MITILVPSRGRPRRAAKMVASVFDTATSPDNVAIQVLVDDDDPELAGYRQAIPYRVVEGLGWNVALAVGPRVGYTATLNRAAAPLWAAPGILGAFGDDVVFRTRGWDDRVREVLATPGMAYGDDGIHGRNHPSAVFMDSAIARALGWLALPTTTHQWADDGWKRLGQATDCLRYLEGVELEHEHPAVGKAEWDETYQSVFADDRAKADYEGFMGWLESEAFARDVTAVRAVLAP